MRFSIIIPTLDEAHNIIPCIKSVTHNIGHGIAKDDLEIIIVDGGSRDRTTDKAASLGNSLTIKIIKLNKANISWQLNRGGKEARGDIFLFLHADCRLPRKGLLRIKDAFSIKTELIGGAFSMTVAGRRFFYRILSAGGNIYCRISRTYFGDRAMFIKKDVFNRLTGFKPMAAMSDFDLSIRMKSLGMVAILKGPVISSGRKFEKEPFYRILYLIIWSIYSFFRGADTEVIRKKYYRQ